MGRQPEVASTTWTVSSPNGWGRHGTGVSCGSATAVKLAAITMAHLRKGFRTVARPGASGGGPLILGLPFVRRLTRCDGLVKNPPELAHGHLPVELPLGQDPTPPAHVPQLGAVVQGPADGGDELLRRVRLDQQP